MRKFYFSIIVCSFTTTLSSQEVLWQKDLKSSSQDFLTQLTVTPDEQFLATGSSIKRDQLSTVSSGPGNMRNNGYDFHLVKLNQKGEEVWEKFFQGNNQDFLAATTSTQEGGFLLAGTSFSTKGLDKKADSFGGSDLWLIKIDEDGNEEWQRTIGTAGDEEARAVIQNTDLSYYVVGSIIDKRSGYGSRDVWILKLDQSGKPTKEILIGGRGLDDVQKMIPTLDGGALIGIYSRSGKYSDSEQGGAQSPISGKSQPNNQGSTQRNASRTEAFYSETSAQNVKNSNRQSIVSQKKSEAEQNVPRISYQKDLENYGQGDFWIIKLDKDGNIEWQLNYGGVQDDKIKSLAITGSGYAIAGESRSKNSGNKKSGNENGTDIWIIGVDKNGKEQFQSSYSFGNKDIVMSLNTIWDPKGSGSLGMLVGGFTQSEDKKEKDDEKYWMLHLDINGKEIWRKHVEGESREREERLVSANVLGDGYILAGTSAKELGKEDWKIVRLGDKQIKELNAVQQIKIYPNPVAEYCYVEIGFDFEDATIEVYDMSGRMINSIKTNTKITKINTASLIQGAYIVIARTLDKSASAKIIKK